MLDHIGLDVVSYDISKSFYESVLAPLGYGVVEETHGFCGFGSPGKPLFWIHERGDDRDSGLRVRLRVCGHGAGANQGKG